MAKGSASKHLQARVAFLDKASQYLTRQHFEHKEHHDHDTVVHTALALSQGATTDSSSTIAASGQDFRGVPILLTSQLRAVAQKSQIRLPQDQKRRTCKVCSTPLIETMTSTASTRNGSRNNKKPWADVRIIQCRTCETEKRFPVGAHRQGKKAERLKYSGPAGQRTAVRSTASGELLPKQMDAFGPKPDTLATTKLCGKRAETVEAQNPNQDGLIRGS